jgi:hypothetical protein
MDGAEEDGIYGSTAAEVMGAVPRCESGTIAFFRLLV